MGKWRVPISQIGLRSLEEARPIWHTNELHGALQSQARAVLGASLPVVLTGKCRVHAQQGTATPPSPGKPFWAPMCQKFTRSNV
eukprot:1149413-Pelagomonas_calceolata.AAC.6